MSTIRYSDPNHKPEKVKAPQAGTSADACAGCGSMRLEKVQTPSGPEKVCTVCGWTTK